MGISANNGFSSIRTEASRSGAFVYLVEVQFHCALQTGQGIHASIPRHALGELAKTRAGCGAIERRKVVGELMSTAKSEGVGSDERRGALWGLAHVAATEAGLGLILQWDSSFVEWCIQGAVQSGNYSLRGTFFHVLGLVGRSVKGARQLARLQWDIAPLGGHSAVAVPRDTSALFATPHTLSLQRKKAAEPAPKEFAKRADIVGSGSGTAQTSTDAAADRDVPGAPTLTRSRSLTEISMEKRQLSMGGDKERDRSMAALIASVASDVSHSISPAGSNTAAGTGRNSAIRASMIRPEGKHHPPLPQLNIADFMSEPVSVAVAVPVQRLSVTSINTNVNAGMGVGVGQPSLTMTQSQLNVLSDGSTVAGPTAVDEEYDHATIAPIVPPMTLVRHWL
jgi:hypothetical protein